MHSWGKEAERIQLKRNQIMLTFPTTATCHKLLILLAKRLNGEQQQTQTATTTKNFDKMSVDELMQQALPANSIFVVNGFQLVLPERFWPLISDVLPE